MCLSFSIIFQWLMAVCVSFSLSSARCNKNIMRNIVNVFYALIYISNFSSMTEGTKTHFSIYGENLINLPNARFPPSKKYTKCFPFRTGTLLTLNYDKIFSAINKWENYLVHITNLLIVWESLISAQIYKWEHDIQKKNTMMKCAR